MTYTEKPLLVFAGPGTGKTRVTTHKLAYLIKEKGYKPGEILALTFSDKATQEMQDRVEELIPGIPGIKISTFHSFCYELIRDNSLELGINAGETVITEEYQQAFLLAHLDELGLEHFEIPRKPIDLAKTFQGAIGRFKQENITIERLEEYLEQNKDNIDENMAYLRDLAKAYRAYEDFKEEKGVLDFGDMQLLALQLFEKRPDILKRYQNQFKHIIVDEFQDTDFIQLNILFRLAPNGNITIVSDDDQSIYRFRGAYLTNMHEFKEFYTSSGLDLEKVILTKNYRYTGSIQKVAGNLIRNNPEREEKNIETEKDDMNPVHITSYMTDYDQAHGILKTIKELHDEGRAWDDMAILMRRRIDALPIIEVLEKSGVPFEILGSREYFRQPVIRAVVSYLKFLADPIRNQPSLGHVMLRPVHGVYPGEFKKLSRYATDKGLSIWEALSDLDDFEGESKHYDNFRLDMEEIHKSMCEKGLQAMVRALLFRKDFFRVEIRRQNVDNIRLLNRFLKLTTDFLLIYPNAMLDDFLVHLEAMASLGLEDESKEPAEGKVHLLTVHGSKGKEFPVVFVPCLNERRFPSRYKGYKIDVPDKLADGIPPKGGPDELHIEEERRLLYVAITRAQDESYLSYCTRYGSNKRDTPMSRFLSEIFDADEGFEHRIVDESVEEVKDVSESIDSAINHRIVACVEREQWQDAVDAVTALALRRGLDISELKVPAELKLQDYIEKLDILYKEPEIEHAEKAEYSPSKLRVYKDCPRQYYYSYVLKIPGEVKTYYELGTVVHEVIEKISRNIKDGVDITEEKALELLNNSWVSSNYISPEEEKQDREAAEKMVREFLERQAGKSGQILDIEMIVEIDIEGRKVKGRVDRVDDVGASLEVIDYKTSKNKTSKNKLKEDFQMAIYWLGVQKAFEKPVGLVGHWYLRMDEEWMVNLTPEELEGVRGKALEAITGIEAGEFSASPDFFRCNYCDYTELCDEKGKK